MTEYAIPPVMLTMSPTTSSYSPTIFNRRSSIRRGTVSSISKDVRVNDFVEEIIKKQKAIQQQERVAAVETSLLRRRHSMMNMSNRTTKVPTPTTPKQQTLRSRTGTMSNMDLKATSWQQRVSQKQQTVSSQKTQQQTDATDKFRLEEQEKPTTLLIQHLRKCAACTKDNHKQEEGGGCSSSSDDDEEEGVIIHSSPSTSTTSSTNSNNRPFLKQHPDSFTLWPSYSPLLHGAERVEQRETIMKDLNSSMTNYSNQIQDLLSTSTAYYHGESLNNKIKECKALVAQQQQLLAQLETTIVDEPPPPTNPPPSTSDIVPKKTTSALQDLCSEIYKGFTLPKSSTTGLIIKQKADKNEADTIISVQGVCTTIESSLIPDRLLTCAEDESDITTFNQKGVYEHKYSLNITHQDRQTKFKLLENEHWQKDDKVNQCSFKQCKQVFNWFQRKHHCRGCGQIYCNTHSGNRLPLFASNKTNQPVFSRVCDKCFYHLTSDSLYM